MRVVLATRNPGKAKQIASVFEGSAIEILTLDQAGIEGAAVEDGNTLEENGIKKARYAHERLREPLHVIADDTGLFIDAFNGEPGVHAAYWGGATLSDQGRMQYALDRLYGIENRGATFRTCVVIISPEGEQSLFYGELKGDILEAPRGRMLPGLPFGVIFLPQGKQFSLDELTIEEEAKISHRGKAFRKAREFLESVAQKKAG